MKESYQEQVGEISKIYAEYADTIENNPNYEKRKETLVPGEMTLEKYVEYCRERAADNYTNDTPEDAEDRFRKFSKLLE